MVDVAAALPESLEHPAIQGHGFEYERIGDALVILGDCFEVLPYLAANELAERRADLLIADPPYGCTDCDWDVRLNLAAWWPLVRRVCKQNAAQCVFCQMPFAAELYESNRKFFRYDLVYRKRKAVGFLNARKMPLRSHELIYVFYEKLPTYNAQLKPGMPYFRKEGFVSPNTCYAGKRKIDCRNPGWRQPVSIIEPPLDREMLDGACALAARVSGQSHNTQKNVHLLAFLIRSYTNRGELVLDPLMGSGSTGCAALRCGRRFIGIEKERRFFDLACERLTIALKRGEDLVVDPEGYEAARLYETARRKERERLPLAEKTCR